MSYLDLVAVIVADYDEAITFFVDVLGFDLVEDQPSFTNDGRPKRWVVVRPKSGGTGLLLAQADGESQREAVGSQFAGRVGLFLRVDDFDATYRRLREAGVEFASEARTEPYGKVAVFLDCAGNKWDLLSASTTHVGAGKTSPTLGGHRRLGASDRRTLVGRVERRDELDDTGVPGVT